MASRCCASWCLGESSPSVGRASWQYEQAEASRRQEERAALEAVTANEAPPTNEAITAIQSFGGR